MATQESLERADRYLAGCDDGCGCDRERLAEEFDAAGNEVLEKAAVAFEEGAHLPGCSESACREGCIYQDTAAAIRAMKEAQS